MTDDPTRTSPPPAGVPADAPSARDTLTNPGPAADARPGTLTDGPPPTPDRPVTLSESAAPDPPARPKP